MPLATAQRGDFVISTEVFEHVAPPVSRAFTGAFSLLKPGGHLILTTPFTNKPATVEHFPDLQDYRIVEFSDDYVLVNRAKDGRYALHENLIFHGGPGTTGDRATPRCVCHLDKHIPPLLLCQFSSGYTYAKIDGGDRHPQGEIHRLEDREMLFHYVK